MNVSPVLILLFIFFLFFLLLGIGSVRMLLSKRQKRSEVPGVPTDEKIEGIGQKAVRAKGDVPAEPPKDVTVEVGPVAKPPHPLGRLLHPAPSRPLSYRLTAVAIGIAAVVIVAILLWLGPSGLLKQYFNLDMGYFLVPSMASAGLFLAAVVTRLWWRSIAGQILYILLAGAGISLISQAVVYYLPETYSALAGATAQSDRPDLYNTFAVAKSARVQTWLLPLGIAGLASCRIILISLERPFLASAAVAGAFTYAGAMVWWATAHFAGRVPLVLGLGIVAFTGLTALGVSRLAWRGLEARNVVLAGMCRWAHRSPVRVLSLGLLVGLYGAFIRPFIFQSASYAIFWDWLIGVSVVLGFALLTGGQIQQLRHAAEQDERWKQWRKHHLLERAFPYEGMRNLVEIQQAFVEEGFKEDLVVYLVAYLRDNRVPLETIVHIMGPLINYVEPPPPRLAVWGTLRRLLEKNKDRRRGLLQDAVSAIAEVASPLPRGHVVRESLPQL